MSLPLLQPPDLPPILDACEFLEVRHHLHVSPDKWATLATALVRAKAHWVAVKVVDQMGGPVREVLVWADVPAGVQPWTHRSRSQVRKALATWLAYRDASEWHCSDGVAREVEANRDMIERVKETARASLR